MTIGMELLEKGYVAAAFLENVLEREKLGGTDLPSGTAVPHGNSTYVNHTVVVVIKNKKKFKWNKYYVDIAFLICIAKRDTFQTRNILSDIYHIIDNGTSLKQLREASSKEVVYKTIGSE